MKKQKQIVEDMWPHGRKTSVVEQGEVHPKLIQYIALGAKHAGMIGGDEPLKSVIVALRDIIKHPAPLMRELRKMGAQSSRAARTIRQIRREV